MSRYLLDSNVLIDAARNREPARSRIQELLQAGDEVGITPVNIAEFFSGTPPARLGPADRFLSSFLSWPVSPEAARQAGIWRHQFARRGKTLGIPDVLIAAVAQEVQAILMTTDTGDFPMEGITLLEP